jgi:hypothetical protein
MQSAQGSQEYRRKDARVAKHLNEQKNSLGPGLTRDIPRNKRPRILILVYFVLFYLVLFYLVLFYLVLFYLVFSN